MVQGDDLPVDHRLIGQCAERRHDAWVFGVEILVVAGPQKDLAVCLDGQRSVAIKLNFVCPVRTLRQ